MVAHDVPQWVEQSFTRSVLAVGASAGRDEIAACCQHLLDMWSKEDRYHHDTRHLFDMLTRIDSMASEIPHSDRVRLAAWFHGIVFSTSDLAVYTRNGGEDEIASAKLCSQLLASLGVEESTCIAVTKLITGLKNPRKIDSGPEPEGPKPDETSTIEMIDMDQIALRDAHLGSLAVEPQKYRHYLDDLQKEYAHIPLAHFLRARQQIVSKLLARKKLFHSPLASQWEESARDNLQAELERLKSKLEQLEDMPAAVQESGSEKSEVPAATQPALAESGVEAPVDNAQHDMSDAVQPDIPDDADNSGTIEILPANNAKHISDTPKVGLAASEEDPRVSSLEKLDDMFSPGPAPKAHLTPEQAQLEERKKTAAQAWQAITEKAQNGSTQR